MMSEVARRRNTWEGILSQKFAYRPGYWESGRQGPPNFYYVFLGVRAFAIQLGIIFRRDGGWKATLLPEEIPSSDVLNTPALNKAYHEKWRTDLGLFKTRPQAAEALKEASLDRGMLAVRRAEILPPLFALVHEAT